MQFSKNQLIYSHPSDEYANQVPVICCIGDSAVSDMFTVGRLEDCIKSFGDRTLNVNLASFCVLNVIFLIDFVTLNYPYLVVYQVNYHEIGYQRILIQEYMQLLMQTISPAPIALEIAQALDLCVPFLLCDILACGTSASVSISCYDSILTRRGWLYMLPIHQSEPCKLVSIREVIMAIYLIATIITKIKIKIEIPRGITVTFEIQMYRLLIAEDVVDINQQCRN